MGVSVALVRKLTQVDPPLREVLLAILEEMEKQRAQWEQSITKTEFNELKNIVAQLGKTVNELAEAQKKTEEKVNELAEAQKELAEAQKKTEEKVNELAKAQKELAEAQKKTEQRLNELAEAQKKTEQRLNELAEAQKKTEQRLNELAEAQKKTEEELKSLSEEVKKLSEEVKKLSHGLAQTRRQVGGLARSVAYALENEAFRKLPALLKKKYGIEVIERLIRTELEGHEINLFGRAKKNGKEIILVGEAVLKLDDREKLSQVWKNVELVKENIGGEVLPIIVTHFARKEILERAQKAGILIIQSFEWD